MGRPKLSDLSCTICNIKFKRKSLLDEHMENHLSPANQIRQSKRQLKNYCYVCKKSFDPENYKLHLQIEHQFDLPKMNNDEDNDFFSYENGFVLLSKKKIKKEIDLPKMKSSTVKKNKSLDVSFADIKIEPTDKMGEESHWTKHQKTENKKSVQKNILKVKVSKLKCSICGMKCKGEKGLKIHMSAHKRSRDNSDHDSSQSENENNDGSKVNQSSKINNNNANVPLLLSNNGAVNFTQNAQPNYILNASHFQNQSNNLVNIGNNGVNFENQASSLNSANHLNTQFLQSVPNQTIQPSDLIPKFDCNSEKYMKWLKKFVYNCKTHNYPLSPDLCRKISVVTEEITSALGNPISSLKHKSNHFYFMSMYNILTEIMLSHLQNALCGVNK